MPSRVPIVVAVLLAAPFVRNAAAAPSTKGCQAAIAAAGRLVFAESLDALAACRAGVATGANPAGYDCRTDAAVVAARTKAAAGAAKRIRRACNDARVAAIAPAGDCTGVVTVSGLVACARASHEAEAELLARVTSPADAVTAAAAQACARAATDAIRSYATDTLGALQRCKRKPGRLAPGSGCRAERGAAKRIARADARARTAIGSGSCDDVAVAATPFAPFCPGAGAANLAPCLLAATDTTVDRLLLAEHPNPGFCGDAGTVVERRVTRLVRRMTLEEKISQMHGASGAPLWRTPSVERLGVPGFRMLDGPRGVSTFAGGNATAFPVAMARGATWDLDLEERVGATMGVEMRAKGGSVILAPTINILNHPRWGRAQETYGEDPFHLGRMGVAFVRGAQRHVVASAKHFAANNVEDTRYTVSVETDERTLREVYLPHFQAAVQDAHVGSIMSAYNRVRGAYCSENAHLLREVLKREWGFRGFVESDWIVGTRSTVAAANAGLDIEMPSAVYFGDALLEAVQRREVSRATIDEAVRRIVRTQLCFRLDSDPPVPDASKIEAPEHLALALEVARKSIVLLKNDAGVLPLARAANPSIVVVGDLAAAANIGDRGSSNVAPSSVVTALDGIRGAAPGVTVTHVAGPPLAPADEAVVAAANAAIVVVGLTFQDEGEGQVSAGDRDGLGLSPEEDALVAAVAAKNPRTIVVLEGGSAITMPWLASVPAVLMAWYPGQRGGTAIGEVLFGDVNPSGRLPLAFPAAEADLPPFDNTSASITYGFLHGQRWLDARGTAPLFPLGHGLSYATFRYANLRIASSARAAGGRIRVLADVTNDGPVAGEEVVQLYVSFPGSRVEHAPKELKAFARVALSPGETKTVVLDVRAADLAHWDTAANAFVVEPLAYGVHVGASAGALLLAGSFTLVD
jgi:beta-glucosidase